MTRRRKGLVFEHPQVKQRTSGPTVVKKETTLSDTSDALVVNTVLSEEVKTGCQDVIVETNQDMPAYRKGYIDEGEDSLLASLSMIEGSPWIVDYYQQYIGRDGEPSGYSEDRIASLQQYRKIIGFELRVNDALSFSHVNEQQYDEVTGGATVYPVLHPNVGDVFIADIGNGRLALLEIDEVNRLSHRKYSSFDVSYHVRKYLTVGDIEAINKKVIDTYRFDKEMLYANGNPLIEDAEYQSLESLSVYADRLTKMYFTWFFDNETKSFTVPVGTHAKVYDIGQAKFIDRIIDKKWYPKYRDMRLQITDLINHNRICTIWDALLEQDWLLIDNASTKFASVPISYLRANELQFNAYYGRYTQFICDYHYERANEFFQYIPRFTAPAELPLFIKEDVSCNRRYIYSVGNNMDYVMSNYFYLGDITNMSRLELLVFKYLHREEICPDNIRLLMEASMRWDDLDRYYYIPILILLAQVVLSGGNS